MLCLPGRCNECVSKNLSEKRASEGIRMKYFSAKGLRGFGNREYWQQGKMGSPKGILATTRESGQQGILATRTFGSHKGLLAATRGIWATTRGFGQQGNYDSHKGILVIRRKR
jgi:hypothetical protein